MKPTKSFLFLLLSICFIMLTCSDLFAQNLSIEMTPGKKIIYVDKIGLPEYVNVNELLQMFPECIARGDELYSNFEIQYDGKSVGTGRDIYLFQTKLSQIEKIEISTSSVATQQNNLYSGTINLIPRKLDEGISGDAYLDASSEPGVLPSADVNYKKEKLQLYGHADLEALWPYDYRTFTQTTPQYFSDGEKISRGKYFQETARLNIKYDFNDKDVLKGWIFESVENFKTDQFQNGRYEIFGNEDVNDGWAYTEHYKDTTYSENKNTIINARGEYSHKFNPNSILTLFAGMELKPRIGSSANHQNAYDGQAKMTFPLLIREDKKLLSMVTGVNVTYNQSTTSTMEGTNTYLSPYFTFQQRSDQWSTDVTFRYQYYSRNFNLLNEKYAPGKNARDHDFTGDINTIWHMKDHHALKLSLVRNIIRPTEAMLFPDPYFDISSKHWKIGNPSLDNAYINTVKLEYMFDWQRNGHNLVFNVNGGYIRADDLIEERDCVIYDDHAKEKQSVQVYRTYENTGTSNIATANMQLMYSYDILTLTLSGNLFSNTMLKNNEKEHCYYYNIGLTPIFNFPGNWMLSGRFIYNSDVEKRYEMNGGCFFGEIKFAKKIGHWTLHIEFGDIFDNVTTDELHSGTSITEYTYDLYNRRVIFGVNYRIGGSK